MYQTEYSYLWVVATASPQTGQAEAILSPVLNPPIINQFLQQFSQSLPPDTHAALIWDGAGFHRAKTQVVSVNVTLIRLPPDSPVLNDIENRWHWFPSHAWSNRVFADYEAKSPPPSLRGSATDWTAICSSPPAGNPGSTAQAIDGMGMGTVAAKRDSRSDLRRHVAHALSY